MPSNKQTVDEIFHAALEIPTEPQRHEYLDDVCGEGTNLRRHVDELLEAHEIVHDFLEHTPNLDLGSEARSAHEPDPDQTQPPKRRFPPRSQQSEELPRKFGDYELLERVAQGGMGVVYKARQVNLNRIVAVKMILTGQFAGPDEVQRFYNEAEAAAHLDHPGIVPVFEVGSCQGQHFFAMGFVDGQSLANEIQQGPLSPRVAAVYAKKIALAVHVAHQQGIVHRDLKPGNVLLDKKREPKITDFGLAKRVEADSNLTAAGMVIGTPSYMPPEQASGELEQINASADVYSLGAILYALLTGRPPFEAKTQVDTLMQVLQDEPVAPRQLVPSVPRDLEAICLKCLEKNPSDRYATADEMALDLERFLAGEPIGAKNDLLRRLRKWTLREPVLAAQLVAILAMMFIILVNYWLIGRGDPRNRQILFLDEAILTAWAVSAILLQKIHNVISAKNLIPLLWAATNPLFLTAALCANDPPRGALYSLYLLLIVTMGFFRRIELVAITTATSMVGYLGLLFLFPDPAVPDSYKAIFAVTLIVTGTLLGFQVLRLKRLSQKDSD